jgi:hypothetical protein
MRHQEGTEPGRKLPKNCQYYGSLCVFLGYYAGECRKVHYERIPCIHAGFREKNRFYNWLQR